MMWRLALDDFDGLGQECSISIAALAMEILQFCTKPSIWLYIWTATMVLMNSDSLTRSRHIRFISLGRYWQFSDAICYTKNDLNIDGNSI